MYVDLFSARAIKDAQPNQIALLFLKKNCFFGGSKFSYTGGVISKVTPTDIFHRNDLDYVNKEKVAKKNICFMASLQLNTTGHSRQHIGDFVVMYRVPQNKEHIAVQNTSIDNVTISDVETVGFISGIDDNNIQLSSLYPGYHGEKNKPIREIPRQDLENNRYGLRTLSSRKQNRMHLGRLFS